MIEATELQEVDLLITGGTVITQNLTREIIPDGAVAVRGATIAGVGPAAAAARTFHAGRVIDASGRYIFPGLINTHTHLFQTFMKGLGHGLPLYEWVDRVTAPSTFAMTAEDGYLSALLGGLEALRSGTTTIVDFMYSLPFSHLYRAVGRACRDLGIRAVLARGLMETGEQHGLSPCQFYPVDRALEEWLDLVSELAAERLSFALAPEIAFGISLRGLQQIRRFASDHAMLITLHINENEDDDRAMLADYGQRAIPFLAELGFWGPDVLAVHCVRMEPADIEILARHDVRISHNPVSNMYLGVGAALVPELRQAGLVVGLGTDGASSNNSQDMLETAKCAALLPKLIHRDPQAMDAASVLDMATIDGARAIGRQDQLGSLEPGKQADLFILDPLRPKSAPVLDPIASLVYSAGQDSIVTTIVAGQVILDEGMFPGINETAILQACQKAAMHLAERVGTLPSVAAGVLGPG